MSYCTRVLRAQVKKRKGNLWGAMKIARYKGIRALRALFLVPSTFRPEVNTIWPLTIGAAFTQCQPEQLKTLQNQRREWLTFSGDREIIFFCSKCLSLLRLFGAHVERAGKSPSAIRRWKYGAHMLVVVRRMNVAKFVNSYESKNEAGWSVIETLRNHVPN